MLFFSFLQAVLSYVYLILIQCISFEGYYVRLVCSVLSTAPLSLRLDCKSFCKLWIPQGKWFDFYNYAFLIL